MKTRRKTVVFLGLILIILSGSICNDASYASKNREAVPACFEVSKAKPERSVLSGWISIDDAYIDEQEMNHKLDMIISGLGLEKSKTKKDIQASENMLRTALSGAKDSVNYVIVIESMKNEDKRKKSYCSFTANYEGGSAMIMEDKMLAEKILADAKLPIKLDILMIGSYKGKVAKDRGRTIINDLLRNINAHKVEGIEDGEIISVSSYSSQINDYIISNGMKVNLQIAMRYSEYDDKTYLWLGCPIIPVEY